MVSKAIASLDAWLARAEEVLAEQREHGLSPSLGLLEGDSRRSGRSPSQHSPRAWRVFWSHCALVLDGGS